MTAQELERLPEAPENEVGLWTDNDYALIYDSRGKAWTTENGQRAKRRHYFWRQLDETTI